jgi:hypothetical protein
VNKLDREPLPTTREALNRRFSLPVKPEESLADEIKEGIIHLRHLAERELETNLSEQSRNNLTAAINFALALIEPREASRMKIYFIVGKYPDGRPGEIFIKADRSGSLAAGALDAVAIMMSIALQHGVPLRTLTDKLRHSRFEPEGYTRDPQFPTASSVVDLLAQWLTSIFPEETGSIQ